MALNGIAAIREWEPILYFSILHFRWEITMTTRSISFFEFEQKKHPENWLQPPVGGQKQKNNSFESKSLICNKQLYFSWESHTISQSLISSNKMRIVPGNSHYWHRRLIVLQRWPNGQSPATTKTKTPFNTDGHQTRSNKSTYFFDHSPQPRSPQEQQTKLWINAFFSDWIYAVISLRWEVFTCREITDLKNWMLGFYLVNDRPIRATKSVQWRTSSNTSETNTFETMKAKNQACGFFPSDSAIYVIVLVSVQRDNLHIHQSKVKKWQSLRREAMDLASNRER